MRAPARAATAAEALTGEIHDLLDGLARRHAGHPEDERHTLLMVAMEREQVVAVAYREDAVAGRVAALPIDDDLRSLAALGGGFRSPWSRAAWRPFCRLSGPVYFSMSGQGRLFVPQMDTGAFPPARRDPLPVRAVRRSAQLALGLRPPPG